MQEKCSVLPSNWRWSCLPGCGGRCCCLPLFLAAVIWLQPSTSHFVFSSYLKSAISEAVRVARCRWCGAWALQRDHADSYSASSLFWPADLCPRCLPRTSANVCWLATSSLCKLEESPGPDTKREQTGRQVSSRSHEERRDICCSGFQYQVNTKDSVLSQQIHCM